MSNDSIGLLSEAAKEKAEYERQVSEVKASYQAQLEATRAALEKTSGELGAIQGELEEAVKGQKRAQVIKLRERIELLGLDIAWGGERLEGLELEQAEKLVEIAAAYRARIVAAVRVADEIILDLKKDLGSLKGMLSNADGRLDGARDMVKKHRAGLQASREKALAAGGVATSSGLEQFTPTWRVSGSNG